MDCFFDGFWCDSYLMVMLIGIVGVMFVFYLGVMDSLDFEECNFVYICLIVKMLMFVVCIYKYIQGQKFVDLINDLFYGENFLCMCFFVFVESYKVSLILVWVMDKIFIFYVDYE